jgi:hypothetical protein
MTILEKIKCSTDKSRFTLYKEGLFYKCYNEDAMVFTKRVKNYKVNSKFVKILGTEVLSIGFPSSEIEKGNLSFQTISEKIEADGFDEQERKVDFLLKDRGIKKDYLAWHKTIVNQVSVQKLKESNRSQYVTNTEYTAAIISMIKNFDLANTTPMQGLTFIQELKLKVQRIEKSNGNN